MRKKSMQKLLLPCAVITLLFNSGCETMSDIGDAIPASLERTPLFFKIDVQQGNSIEQPMVNRLEPDMSKSQVQFIMGTPLLIDVFHQNRWDYYYSMNRGSGALEQKHVALFFDDGRLVRTEGDIRPEPVDDKASLQATEVYSVPDYNYKKGIITRMLEGVGLEKE
jgi:outer membrane protein assembly factor BamE